MLGQNLQVLGIDYTIAPWVQADVAERTIRVPVLNHSAHVCNIDNAVGVEVTNRAYGRTARL